MAADFKYSLTRICLRSGQLQLPYAMRELFPSEGTVRAFDTEKGEEFELNIVDSRRVAGFEPFLEAHNFEVNDEILIRPLEDGRYALTPLLHPKKPDYTRKEVLRDLCDKVVEMAPLSEMEIRKLFPQLPSDLDLSAELAADGRLVRREGRWHSAEKIVPELQRGPASRATTLTSGKTEPVADEPLDSPPNLAADTVTDAPDLDEVAPLPASPEDRDELEPERIKKGTTVTPYPHGVIYPGSTGLNSQEDVEDNSYHQQARTFLETFGFRLEPISHSQLLVHAMLGRKRYKVLVHLLAEGARLDWAALLARRRETDATYLAVFGDHRDLIRLHSPADMARATLWSWQALARVQELVETVPISPLDLESHFERDGLFERGLERFEKSVGKRVAERGIFSQVLSRLAVLKAPATFMLDDLLYDDELEKEHLLAVLGLLSQAPFHLVNRVDSGEFCLRYPVSEGLWQLSRYALSLRQQLPKGRTERIVAAEGAVAEEPAEAEAKDDREVAREAKINGS